MGSVGEYIWYLKFQIKDLKSQLASYQNGNKIRQLRESYEALCKKKDQQIRRLQKELADAHAETVTVRKYWSEIFDDLESEHRKDLLKKDRETRKHKDRSLLLERQVDAALDKTKEWRQKYYEQSERIEELEEKNKKLTAQVNKDFETSSIPSSMQGEGRKKIPNSREKTGRAPGGQKKHKGHRLTYKTPTASFRLPDPEEYVNNPDYVPTERIVKRQKIGISIRVNVIEYTARVFRNTKTGTRVHAAFPDGFDTDVRYDSSVKAVAFLLANECNVSARKTARIISDLTGGEIRLSAATVNGLVREFSSKSEQERAYIVESLMMSPVIHVDFTNANVNGEAKQVLIMASSLYDVAHYIARDTKGHKGIQGTPLESYAGTLVHDHDVTFYSYGTKHQECQQHNTRYIKGSIENEPDYEWNTQMLDLTRRMIHYKNSVGIGNPLNAAIVRKFEKEYDRILVRAKEEYEERPPGKYYKEGYNLYRRLVKYKESELRFLHEPNVPANNSLAERLARVFKRKQKQATVLRSNKSFECLCNSLGPLYILRVDGDNMFAYVQKIFDRPKPKPSEDAAK